MQNPSFSHSAPGGFTAFFINRLGAGLAAALLIFFSPAQSGAEVPEGMEHGNFRLVFSGYSHAAGKDSEMTLFYQGGAIPHSRQSVSWANSEKITHQECETLRVSFVTGGSAGRHNDYLLTSCKDLESATFISGDETGLSAVSPALAAQGAAFAATDGSFVTYAKRAMDGAVSMELSREKSPLMTRLLVFDGATWRLDPVGMFAAFYKNLAAAAEASAMADPQSAAAKAMKVAYYSVLAGGEIANSARDAFMRCFPQEYAPVAGDVFDDMARAAINTAPSFISIVDVRHNAKPAETPTVVLASEKTPLPQSAPPAAHGEEKSEPLAATTISAPERKTPEQANKHTVKTGDTVYSLGRMYGVSPVAVMRANPQFADADKINVGDVVLIPETTPKTPAPGKPTKKTPPPRKEPARDKGEKPGKRHTVKYGETIYSLGRLYKVHPLDIRDANPQHADLDRIKAGDVLEIPAPARKPLASKQNR